MYRHFRAIAEAVDLPVILYNVPGRTVADMSNETILRLAEVPGIIGVKEATGNIDRAAHLIKHAPANFSIFSGDDPTAIALMLLGGHGNISVTANVAPKEMSQLCRAAIEGDAITARRIHLKLLSLHKQLFCESNPIPAKWALQALGRMEGGIRLPLTPLDARYHDVVRDALRDAGLLA
jgi:4-hydroxy-tetrahydrodipicolinate synthase